MTFADVVALACTALALLLVGGMFGRRYASAPLFVGFGLRVAVVVLRAAGFQPVQRTEDAVNFAEGSRGLLDWNIGIYAAYGGGAGRHESLLSWLQGTVGLSVFGLETVGVLVWLLGGFLVLATIRCAVGEPFDRYVMWMVVLLPSGLIWTSGILREPYEFTIVALAVWVLVRLHQASSRREPGFVPVLTAALVLMAGSVFHVALPLAGAVLLMGWTFVYVLRHVAMSSGRVVAVTLAFVLIFFSASALAVPAARFQERRVERSSFDGKASYRSEMPNLGPLTVPADVTVGYVLYVVAPLPWQMRGPIDLIAFSESALRVAIMVACVRRRTELTTSVLLVAVGIQLGFSVGTLNWGTALRHNYISVPALALLAAIVLSKRQAGPDGAPGADDRPMARRALTGVPQRSV